MARGGLRGNNCCPECGQQFEILNGDVQFSLNLHLQSHKSLESITQEIEQRMKNVQIGPKNKSDYTCPECKESVVIFNNDISFSLQHHAQKHKPVHTVSNSEDRSSTSSGKSKSSEKKFKSVTNPTVSKQIDILDGIFDSMPTGSKLHRGFISENKNGKAMCNICNVTIEPMSSIYKHLKTRSHEDKAVSFLTNMLPTELRHVMKFVSFYGSKLYCNLCRNNIVLGSDNPYITIINIMSHNSSKGHLQYKANEESRCYSDEAAVILKSLSKISPAVNSNKNLIECKMQPQFNCKLCDKNIAYDENEKILCQKFESHLLSKGHLKCVEAFSIVEAFNLSQFLGKEKHNLLVTKGGNIYCTICNSNIVANFEQVVSHIKQRPNIDVQSVTQTPPTVIVSDNVTSLKSLLNSLPPQLRNTTCVVEGNNGKVTCLVCNCNIPASTYNLATHLYGKNHNNMAEEKSASLRQSKQGGSALKEDLVKNLFLDIPVSLRKHTKFISAVSKEKLHCSVCNYDLAALNNYLLEHLQSTAHAMAVEVFEFNKFLQLREQNVASKDICLDNLKKTDGSVKSYAKYLIDNGKHYKCCLCDRNILKANDEKNLKGNILGHMNGEKHKKSQIAVYYKLLDKLEVSDPSVKAERQFLETQRGRLFCTLCFCNVSASTKFEAFRINILGHLRGSQHNGNKLKMTQIN